MKPSMIRVFLLVLSALWSPAIIAQQAWTYYNTGNSPLPENSVRCITTAPNGTKWVGTDYGLASFDGTTWTVYTTMNSGLPDNSIRSLLAEGTNVWVGTFFGGLAKFDGSSWTIYNMTNSSIPDDFVRSLAKNHSGGIWVGTIGGLALFDGLTWNTYNMTNTPLLSNNISALWSDSISTMVGTINGGLGFLSGGSWQHFTLLNSNLPDNSCLGLVRDVAGTPWMATPANGLSAYVGGIQFLTLSTSTSGIASNSTTCIAYHAPSDEIWMGSLDAGLIRKNGLNFFAYGTSNGSLPDNVIQCVHVDPQGIVWAGMQSGGLVRLDPNLLNSVAWIDDQNQTLAYPNPAVDKINFDLSFFEGGVLEIHDLQGRQLHQETLASGFQTHSAVISHLATGKYRATVRENDGKVRRFGFVKAP